MDQKLPMFDDDTPVETAPKKPKPKPMRKRRRNIAIRKRVVAAPYKPLAESPFTNPKVARLIGDLMNLEIPLRNFVMEVTRALTK